MKKVLALVLALVLVLLLVACGGSGESGGNDNKVPVGDYTLVDTTEDSMRQYLGMVHLVVSSSDSAYLIGGWMKEKEEFVFDEKNGTASTSGADNIKYTVSDNRISLIFDATGIEWVFEKASNGEDAKPNYIELKLGETYSIPDSVDITITKFDFSQKATSPDSDGINLIPSSSDYVCANLYYDVKYTGKTKTYSDYFKPSHLDYDNGYTFDLETFYYYDNKVKSWLNSGDIEPLTPEFSCKACFFVPKEVENNKDKPVVIIFDRYGCTFSPRT